MPIKETISNGRLASAKEQRSVDSLIHTHGPCFLISLPFEAPATSEGVQGPFLRRAVVAMAILVHSLCIFAVTAVFVVASTSTATIFATLIVIFGLLKETILELTLPLLAVHPIQRHGCTRVVYRRMLTLLDRNPCGKRKKLVLTKIVLGKLPQRRHAALVLLAKWLVAGRVANLFLWMREQQNLVP